MNKLTNTKNYQTFLKDIKKEIQTSQIKALGSLNVEMTLLYYRVGKALHQKQREEGWGRDTLIQKIKQEVHKKEGKLISNFKAILPPRNSELVQQSFKDPYLFDFLTIDEPFRKRKIELKKGEFKPSYSDQVNFYCSVVDDILAHKDDNPTIGLILCQEKDEIVAEYSLRNMSQPIGISEYELTEILPKEFASSLPTIEMLENEFLKIEE
jgi:hypothetical protein